MVTRAQRPGHRRRRAHLLLRVVATLTEVGLNHFFRGKDHPGGGDQVYFQGHASPGVYARAFLEGRLSADQLDGFRQELSHPGGGLPSYPHPRLAPDLWEFPTVSMGLGPINAIYQAWTNRYLHLRGIKDTSQQDVWAFLGDGEMDEPESRGMLQLAASRGWTTSRSSSTATCSGSTARSAATARSSRSSRRSSAAPAGTSSRSSGAASGTRCSPPTGTARSST